MGVSATKGYHVNSLAVPRKAKEAIGGITRLTHKDGKVHIMFMTFLCTVVLHDSDIFCSSGLDLQFLFIMNCPILLSAVLISSAHSQIILGKIRQSVLGA